MKQNTILWVIGIAILLLLVLNQNGIFEMKKKVINGYWDEPTQQCRSAPDRPSGIPYTPSETETTMYQCCFNNQSQQIDCNNPSDLFGSFAIYQGQEGLFFVTHGITITNTGNVDLTNAWIESANWTPSNTGLTNAYSTVIGSAYGSPLGQGLALDFSTGQIDLQAIGGSPGSTNTYDLSLVAKSSAAGLPDSSETIPASITVEKEGIGYSVDVKLGGPPVDYTGYWSFDGDAFDESFNGNDGTLSTPTVIDDMDSLNGWSATSINLISLNNFNYQEGTGAINLYQDLDALGEDITLQKSITPTDYTGKVINYYIYIGNQNVIDAWGGGVFYLLNDGGNFFRYSLKSKSDLTVGWNVFTADADNPISSSGTPDITNITIIKLSIEGQHAGARQVLEGELIIDYIVMNTPMKCKDRNGIDNKAYKFSANSYISLMNLNEMPEDFTISFWWKKDGPGSDDYVRFIDGGYFGGATGYGFFFGSGSSDPNSNQVSFEVRTTDGNTPGAIETQLTEGDWYLLTATKEGRNIEFYVNDLLIGTKLLTQSEYRRDKTMIVGGSSTSNKFNGKIDEVKIFNRALSQNEINEIYNS